MFKRLTCLSSCAVAVNIYVDYEQSKFHLASVKKKKQCFNSTTVLDTLNLQAVLCGWEKSLSTSHIEMLIIFNVMDNVTSMM